MQAARAVSISLALFMGMSLDCHKHVSGSDELSCDLPKDLVDDIVSYEKDVSDIIDFVLKGPFKGKTFDDLAEFVDRFGARISGSEALEKSISFLVDEARKERIQHVTTEGVTVPYWQRGYESAKLIEPHNRNIEILGLGNSIGTGPTGIVAEVVLVHSFEELAALGDEEVMGKIVVYNQRYEGYAQTVKYRTEGAAAAAVLGAVAALVRSITNFSMNTAHTGIQHYKAGVREIPVAAITTEDADFLDRINSRGHKMKISLILVNSITSKSSRNVIVDLPGTVYPQEQIIVSGHVDWDRAQWIMVVE